MDYSKAVDYEGTHTFELLLNDEPTGIMAEVRSSGSAAVRSLVLEHTDKQIERFAKKKLPTAIAGERSEIEKMAACIVSWDWGKDPKTGEPNKWGDGPLPDMKNKKAAMEVLRVNWIYDQVSEEAGRLENFMQRSA